ncbi:unnamed protein product [Prunus armeniaca]|uniref:Uncharacterized protein n=1 Tax=Prunus armeniaca TaxID=36596 RepID=A0A6J5XVB1_PRUAR|nr:unnamed protein product [Prunus armeniaca]
MVCQSSFSLLRNCKEPWFVSFPSVFFEIARNLKLQGTMVCQSSFSIFSEIARNHGLSVFLQSSLKLQGILNCKEPWFVSLPSVFSKIARNHGLSVFLQSSLKLQGILNCKEPWNLKLQGTMVCQSSFSLLRNCKEPWFVSFPSVFFEIARNLKLQGTMVCQSSFSIFSEIARNHGLSVFLQSSLKLQGILNCKEPWFVSLPSVFSEIARNHGLSVFLQSSLKLQGILNCKEPWFVSLPSVSSPKLQGTMVCQFSFSLL